MKPKTKKCKICNGVFTPFKTTQRVCGLECAKAYAKEKERKKAAKEWRKRKTELKSKLETRTQKINKVRKVFQQYIRLRDQHLPCISCGAINPQKWDAGHYLKAELYTGLIFDENNTWRQCQKCNQHGGGMPIEYRIGLVQRIGEEKVKALERKKDALRTYIWSDKELSDLMEKYKAKIKILIQNK